MKCIEEYELNLSVKNCYFTHVDCIKNAEDAVRIFSDAIVFRRLPEEHIWAIAVNAFTHPIGLFEIAHGTVDIAIFKPADVFKRLLLVNASGFIMIHNHPSGNVDPSEEDKEINERLRKLGEELGIELLDFIIVGSNEDNYISVK